MIHNAETHVDRSCEVIVLISSCKFRESTEKYYMSIFEVSIFADRYFMWKEEKQLGFFHGFISANNLQFRCEKSTFSVQRLRKT